MFKTAKGFHFCYCLYYLLAMADIPAVSDIKIPDDAKFDEFRKRCLEDIESWSEVYKDERYQVWSRKSPDFPIDEIKARTVYTDIEADVLYDVLHDHEYRAEWDENMLEGYVIELLNKNSEIGYYSGKMPSPVSNRDFCNLRSWKVFGDSKEYIIFNYSVKHDKCPEKKNFVRAQSVLSGYYIRALESGCEFIYYSQSDPKGWIPSWIINFFLSKFPPKLLDKLHTVSLEYPAWKSTHNPEYKPWLETE
ncbi:START domain-containing protein 10-like [Schistocerca gregaria]|uniref:START domain-containing protein 10-like n=1 Tax=Schistocerca gregaria TaxID=7010 RepID=UPI00211F020A|nr:START domain-containing protein 10-like [Schistocerca gregaria]